MTSIIQYSAFDKVLSAPLSSWSSESVKQIAVHRSKRRLRAHFGTKQNRQHIDRTELLGQLDACYEELTVAIMEEIGERERINQELREQVHVLLDNLRVTLLSFQGSEAMKVRITAEYEKYDALASDRSKRLKSDTLRKFILATKKLIIMAGGKVEDNSTIAEQIPAQSVPQPPESEILTLKATVSPSVAIVTSPDVAEKVQTISIAPVASEIHDVIKEKSSVDVVDKNATIQEISPVKITPEPAASNTSKNEMEQQNAETNTVSDAPKYEDIQQKVLIRELISEAAKLKQQPQIPWRRPTRLEPLMPKSEKEERRRKEKDERKKKSVEHFVKPIENVKEPERLALKYKLKKRPAEEPLNDAQFKKPTLPPRHEQLFQRRHQLSSVAPQPNRRDPRTNASYCQQRMMQMTNQQRFESQNQQYFRHRPHAPHHAEKPVAAAHPFVSLTPALHSNPPFPHPGQQQTAAALPFAVPPPVAPSKPQTFPRTSVQSTTRHSAPVAPVAPAEPVIPVTAHPKSAAQKAGTRKTNPVYAKDEPIPLGKKELPKKSKKTTSAGREKSQEELKKDEQSRKTVAKSGQHTISKCAPIEHGLQKNLMDLLKEMGDEEKVKQILDVMNKKSDDEAEVKSKENKQQAQANTKQGEVDAKESVSNGEAAATKEKKGKKFKRILIKDSGGSSSEDETSKKEENRKEKPKKRVPGGSREVSALIENVSDWISKGGEKHYTRRRGAIIQPTSAGPESAPEKQTKAGKSNEDDPLDDEVEGADANATAVDMVIADEVEQPTVEKEDSLLTVTKSPPTAKGKQKSKDSSFVYNDKNTIHYNSTYSSNCALCSFNGSAIVDHYVYEHKQYEVFVSRVSPKMAEIIRADLFLTNGSIISAGAEDERIRFKCYFCLAWQELNRTGWVEHMASHTGEYRYRCTSCPVMSKTEELESCFYHEKTCLKSSLAVYNNVEFKDNHMYGFICNACNYIQIRRVNMERHLKREHPSSDVVCSRFSMVNYKIDAKPIIDEDQVMAELSSLPTVMIPIHPKAEPLEPCEIVNQPFTEDDEMGALENLFDGSVPRRRTEIRLESIHLGPSGIPNDLGHRPFSFKIEQELQGTQISSSGESPMSPEPADLFVEAQQSTSEAEAIVPIIQIQSVQGAYDFNQVKHEKDGVYDSDASDRTVDFNMSDSVEEHNGESASDGDQKGGDAGSNQTDENSGAASSGGGGGEESASAGSGSGTGGAAGGAGGGDDGDDRKSEEFPLPFSIKEEKDEEEQEKEESTDAEKVVIKTEKPDDTPSDPPPAEGDFDFVELVLDSTRIEHVAYIEHQSEMLFLCLMPGCQYISKKSDNFSTHVSLKHSTTDWDGYCHPCQSQIVIAENCTIGNELQHLLDVHARRKTPTLDIPASTTNVLRIRRIPGDTLSKDTNPPPLTPIMPPNTIVAGPSGVSMATNPIIITSAATIAPVVTLSGNTVITPTHTIPAQIRPVIQPAAAPLPTVTIAAQPPALAPVSNTASNANGSVSSNVSAMANLKINTVRLKPWTNMVTTKNQDHCRNMLEEIALLCLYKCMSRSCAFTTNNRFFMEQHLQLHNNLHNHNSNSRKCWLECAYCDIIAMNNNVLLAHIDAEHATCGFQCNLCFYRSRDPTNVVVHQKTYHPLGNVPKRILIMPDHLKSFGDDEWKAMQESLRKNVLPLHCTICKESFYILSAFMTHLMGHDQLLVLCQVCNVGVEKRGMARHLLLHSIGLYECVYCLFGANTKSTMALHVSNAHCSKPLYCCVRYNKKRPDGVDYPPKNIESMELKTMSCTVSPDLFKRCNYTPEQLNFKPISVQINQTMAYPTNEPVVTKILSSAIATPASAPPGTSAPPGPASNIQIQITDEAGRPLIISIPVQNAKPAPGPAAGLAPPRPAQVVAPHQTTITAPSPVPAPPPIQMPMISSVQGGVQTIARAEQAPLPVISSVQGMAPLPPLTAIPRNDGLPVISCVQSVAQLPPEGPAATTLVPKPASLMTITSTSGMITIPNIPGITITAKKVNPPVLSTTPIITNVQSISTAAMQRPATPAEPAIQITASPIAQLQEMVSSTTATTSTASAPEQAKNDMYATTVAEADTQSSNSNGGISVESEDDSQQQSERSKPSTPVPSPLVVPTVAKETSLAKKFASTTQIRIDFLFKGSIDKFDRLERKVSQMIEHTGFYGTALNICGVEDCHDKFSDPVKLNLHLLKFHNLSNYSCHHCSSRFKTAHELITHVKTHGRHRYLCFLCDKKSHFLKMMILHVQHDHNSTDVILTYLHPKKRDIHNDLVVICPQSVTSGQLQDYVNNILKEDGVGEKRRFTPNEVDQLPVEEIFTEDMFCANCDYTTKIRKNLKRHLEKHNEATATASLATMLPELDSLSVEIAEVPKFIVATKEVASAPNIPQRVEPIKLYQCGVCRFDCPPVFSDLRTHLYRTHRSEKNYRCAHCKATLSDGFLCIDKIANHLKLHGENLYQCNYPGCEYFREEKILVLAHIKQNHGNVGSVLILREAQMAVSPEWQCDLCETIRPSRDDMVTHMVDDHKLTDNQFKCSYCSYKSSNNDVFKSHFATAHPKSEILIISLFHELPPKVVEVSLPHAADDEVASASKKYSCGIETCAFVSTQEVKTQEHFLEQHPDQTLVVYDDSGIEKEKRKRFDYFVKYVCYFCQTQCDLIDDIVQHWSKVHKENGAGKPLMYKLFKLVRCYYCDKLSTYYDITSHCATSHVGQILVCIDHQNAFKCGVCPHVVTGEKTDLLKHFKVYHSFSKNEDPCDYMDDEFLHRMLEQNNTLYTCNHCKITFETRYEYENHIDICSYAGEPSSFTPASKSVRIRYICSCCPEMFTNEYNIAKHMRTHIAQYNCRYCKREFKQLGQLNEHQVLLHNATDSDFLLKDLNQFRSQFLKIKMLFPNGLVLSKVDAYRTVCGSVEDIINYTRNINDEEMTELMYSRVIEMPLIYEDDDGQTVETICKDFIESRPKMVLEMEQLSEMQLDEICDQVYLIAQATGSGASRSSTPSYYGANRKRGRPRKKITASPIYSDDDGDDDDDDDWKPERKRPSSKASVTKPPPVKKEPVEESDFSDSDDELLITFKKESV